MKLTLQDQIDDFRTAVGDNNYSESEIIRYLNKAQLVLARKLDVQIPLKRTMSTVAYQEEYTLPTKLREILDVRCEDDKLRPYTKKQIENLAEQDRGTTGTVDFYWRFGDKLGLRYIPDESAETTTLYAAITSTTATSFQADYTADLPERGAVTIEDERIYYTNITHTDTTYTTFAGLARGAEGTKAATHVISSTVTWRDIELFGYAYPSKFLNKPNSGSVAKYAGSWLEVGTYIYKMTYYSTSLAMESLAYTIGSVATASAEQATSLTSLAVSTDTDIDYKRIYRTLVGGSIYYYVTEVTNATTSVNDTATDATVGANDQLAEPYSELDEDWHDLITWQALSRYFEDTEEAPRANYWAGKVLSELPDAIWEEHKKAHQGYHQLPLPA